MAGWLRVRMYIRTPSRTVRTVPTTQGTIQAIRKTFAPDRMLVARITVKTKQISQKENEFVPFNPSVFQCRKYLIFFKMLGQVWERNSLSPFQQNACNREVREAVLLATLKTQSEPTLFPTFSECACISGDRIWLMERDLSICGNILE